MARTNKYTSINFNHVIDKTLTSSSSNKNHQTNQQNQPSFASYSPSASNAKTQGRMLVLTRTSPKPISTPPIVSPNLTQPPQQPSSGSDQISLRPIYRPGSDKEKEKEGVFVAGPVKPNRFVPPHLRPGFVGREEKPEREVLRGREPGLLKHEDRRPPKSGGYEKIQRGGDLNSGLIGRPRSSGNHHPTSSG